MKVLIFGYGTRGDIQPFVALAVALREAGHQPLLAAPAGSASLAADQAIPFAPLFDGLNTMMAEPAFRRAIETNFRGLRGKLLAVAAIRRTNPMLRRVLDDLAAVPAADVDLVVHPVNFPVHHLAEKLGVPAVAVGLQPGWVPTAAEPHPNVPIRIPARLNRVSYRAGLLPLAGLLRTVARWRTETLGLGRSRRPNDPLAGPGGRPVTVLQAFSRQVVPGVELPDWVHTTGYWFLPAAPSWTPPERLRALLDSGEPVVTVGFGSMAGTDPARVGQTVINAAGLAGVRLVLITGWGGIDAGAAGDRVLIIDQVPHDWLFARATANVHHGGSGTTAAALRSGRPQVICPFIADQPYWARRMQDSGVAPAPLPQRGLTAEGLAAALRQVVDDAALRARAEQLGARIRAENGVGNAVRVLESVAAG